MSGHDEGMAARDEGMQTALFAADVAGRVAAEVAIEALAREGREFTAEDVRARVGGPLGAGDGTMGALFAAAARAGIIRHAGFTRARRPEAHGRWIMTWQGAGGQDRPGVRTDRGCPVSSRYSRADFLDLLRTSPGLSDAAVRLALVLDGYARATGRCWPSQRRLARDLGWSLRKAERTMAELLSAGLVVYLERARHRGEQSEIELRTTVTDGTAAKSDGGSSGGTTVTDGGGGGGEPPSPVTRTTVTDGGQKQYMKQEEPTSDVETPDPEVSDEVRLLTRHLATRIRDNGFKLPGEGTKARRSWLLEMDRLLRLDEADPAEVPQIIDWSTADDFWRANIRSAPKFRKQYPTLRLRWLSSNGHGGGDRASLIGTGGVPS